MASLDSRPAARGKRKRDDGAQVPLSSRLGGGASPQPSHASSTDSDCGKTVAKSKPAKSAAGRKPKLKAPVNQPVECLVSPWPDFFTSLDKTYRALNLVFTFCCTRKHLATTFDTIKSTVESHTKRELRIDDVAAIAALRPDGVNFAYVDEVMLQIDVRGAERDDTFKAGGGSRSRQQLSRSQGIAPDASVGGITGLEGLDGGGEDRELSGREVLYFELVDGDLKRQVQDRKTGEPVGPKRKLRDEDLKIPVYSQKQMTSLIERRNNKFVNAINLFLNRCVAENLDPEETLRREAIPFVPVPSETPEEQQRQELASALPEIIPKERKSIPEIVQELKDSSWYTGQIVPDGHRVFEPQEPIYGDLEFLLSQGLVNALYNAKGITQFYAHQAEALNSLHRGHNVVVATSTSSGKSLIYQLPVLYALEKDHDTRAMYIFPTKALAQDQKRSLKEMVGYMPGLEDTLVETFDGDTPFSDRNLIREEARIIFTNPDMLHITILPQEERWRTFLKNLKYVVGKVSLTGTAACFRIG